MGKLDLYQKKRDFSKTAEPSENGLKDSSSKLIFTVQRHHASRLHYDFRLEIDGVLKSWAVPKGPSLNPKDRRLAVEVEDHPLSYADFEGSIPKGNYGAGTVVVFDSGTYDLVAAKNEKEFLKQWKEGSIKFDLHGEKLKGEFALVRMKGDDPTNWLLIKHKDEYAVEKEYDAEDFIAASVKKEGKTFKKEGTSIKKKVLKTKEATPETSEKQSKKNGEAVPAPMLTKLSPDLPDGAEWIYEKKFDGFRILAEKNGEKTNLYSRNGNLLNKQYPSIVKALAEIDKDFVLDGELVIENKQNQSQFQLLKSGEPIAAGLSLNYYVFDMLSLDGNDLRDFELENRKELLRLFLEKVKAKQIHFVPSLDLQVDNMLVHAEENKWEGVIAKDKTSTYLSGKRSSSWLKIKLRNTQEAIICGYTAPQGGRKYFGALVLGVMEKGELLYIGNCGTGFNDDSLKELHGSFSKLIRKTKPFPAAVKIAKAREVTWLSPKLVCDVYYSEWTMDRHLRHPVYKGLRADKSAEETKLEVIEPQETEKGSAIEKEKLANEKELVFGKKKVSLTNLNKIYWPKEQISKGEMLSYYEQIADFILPYLKDKPISLNRYPNGIDKPGFFQKDVEPKQLPSWVKTTEIYSKSTEKTIDYLLCNDVASLLFIANLGSIEINPWLSTYKKPEKPQFAVLDLDPNGADFKEVVQVALSCHDILNNAEVPHYIKTSGSSGLHIYMNMDQKYDYELVRDFVQLLAEMLQSAHPDTTSIIRDPKKRKNLIYLDYLQNKQGQTIAAPYSVRPKPGATVSAPLHWEEVNDELSIKDFDIFSMPKRLKDLADPWENIWKDTVDLKAAIKKF